MVTKGVAATFNHSLCCVLVQCHPLSKVGFLRKQIPVEISENRIRTGILNKNSEFTSRQDSYRLIRSFKNGARISKKVGEFGFNVFF